MTNDQVRKSDIVLEHVEAKLDEHIKDSKEQFVQINESLSILNINQVTHTNKFAQHEKDEFSYHQKREVADDRLTLALDGLSKSVISLDHRLETREQAAMDYEARMMPAEKLVTWSVITRDFLTWIAPWAGVITVIALVWAFISTYLKTIN